ncbi:S8 family peptidase [Halomontanus rarus]|uniref:S8 family peptidase n=1 Tax=Halomontanus rarus TaxID=3034020 RepID=UPI00307BD4DC
MHSRRQFLSRAAAVPFAPLAVGSAYGTDSLTTLALAGESFGRGWEPIDEAQLHGSDKTPSWTIKYTEGDRDRFDSWLEEDDRELIAEHTASRKAVVKSTSGDIGVGLLNRMLGNGLQAEPFIESIDLNIEASYADPVSPTDDSAWESFGWAERTFGGAGDLEPDAVAFDADMAETTLEDARTHTGAIGLGVDTSGLTVAVIDSGVNDGPMFEDSVGDSRLLPESKDFVTDAEPTLADDSEAVTDENGHGSWVASCIASSAAEPDQGYCPDADILALRALDGEGSGSTADISNAVRYAADQGADVLCMSLGSPLWSEDLDSALEYATDAGTIPVVAVGNDRQMTRWVAAPASSSHAIGVAAVTSDPPEEALSAYFSNIGPHPGTTDHSGGASNGATPNIAAPGCKISVPVVTASGRSTDSVLTGTSMAAPCVASGVVGLLIASEGALEYDDVVERMETYAAPIPKAAVVEVGAGMAHAENAIAESEPEETQDEAMTDEATTRNEAYKQLANAQGGRVLQYLV